jgi:DegV family protein with EDD domain
VAGAAIVTDSAADLPPDVAERHGIFVVPLLTTFGEDTYRVGRDMSAGEFWARLTAVGSAFPTTAASAPTAFQEVYEAAFSSGADGIVAIHVAGTLSAALKSARIAREAMADREIHIVDSWSASGGTGLLALAAADLRDRGKSAQEIADAITAIADDLRVYLMVETLEYLRRGGRISGAQATVGTLLSVKPIITIGEGKVETVERVRTRGKARERLLELLATGPVERVFVLHGMSPDVDDFTGELLARLPGGVPEDRVVTALIGASVGTHLGPGCVGAAVLLQRAPAAGTPAATIPTAGGVTAP